MRRYAKASGIIHGREDLLVRPIEECFETKDGRVMARVRGMPEVVRVANLEGLDIDLNKVKGLSLRQTRAFCLAH